jgi:hypothetical protein
VQKRAATEATIERDRPIASRSLYLMTIGDQSGLVLIFERGWDIIEARW